MTTHTFTGNIVTETEAFYGRLTTADDRIADVAKLSACQENAEWILPGFIDVHVHGLGAVASETLEDVSKMAEFGVHVGLTGFLPTVATVSFDRQVDFVANMARFVAVPPSGRSRVLGSHLEGPFIAPANKGGMLEKFLLPPNLGQTEQLLRAADGTLRLMTISPELDGAADVIRRLHQAGVTISAGHTNCNKTQLETAIEAGLSQICHIFDTFNGRLVDNGVSQPCLADLALIDERLMLELIPDGIHVPPELVKLARLAAGARRLIAITDAVPGAGLPAGVFHLMDGREYTIAPDDVARTNDSAGMILGSCLTLNRAFFNLTTRFGFTEIEAALMTSGNAARNLGLGDRLGFLKPGYQADIAILASDRLTVTRTLVAGETAYAA